MLLYRFNLNRLHYFLLLFSLLRASALQPERSTGRRRRWNTFPVKTASDDTCELYLRAAPLIGGPSWLPLHVQVVIESEDNRYKWDFVPLNATDPSTLGRLLSLQAVPGEIRCFYAKGTCEDEKQESLDRHELVSTIPKEEPLLLRAQEFCDSYEDRNLHLVQNNCCTFAFQLYNYLRTKQS